MAEVDQGGDPFVDRNKAAAEKQREQLTFADLVDDYLAERHELASASEIERELRKDAVPVLGKKRPSQITPADIDQLASKLLAPGRNTKVMARRLIQRLKALFNYALLDAPAMAEKYGITMNPAASVGRRRPGSAGKYGKPEKRTRVLTDAEIGALWRAMSTSGMRKATQLALKLVLVTAQRTGELRIARKAELHLDLAEPVWIIPREHTKNRKAPHVVPLSPLAGRLFVEALAIDPTSELILPGPDGPNIPAAKTVIPTAMGNLHQSHLKHLEDTATPHDLRRTAATGMRALGVPREIVSLILNHASIGVTAQHYDHHEALPERRQALARWAEHLEKIVSQGTKSQS